MTRRSMPSSFHANLFALVPARWHCQNIGAFLIVKGLAQGGQVAGWRGRRKFLKKVLALRAIVRIINFVA